MADPTPAQIEAAARALSKQTPYVPTAWAAMAEQEREPWRALARAALTAAAQVQRGRAFVSAPDVEPGDGLQGSWTPAQPTPEADERETLQEWIDKHYPDIPPTGIHRSDYRRGDEPATDDRRDIRDALEEFADDLAAPHSRPTLVHHGHAGYPSDGDCTACRALEPQPAPRTVNAAELERLVKVMDDARWPEGFWVQGSSDPPEADDETILRALLAALNIVVEAPHG